jgi:rubredoxin
MIYNGDIGALSKAYLAKNQGKEGSPFNMKCPVCTTEKEDSEFKGFKVWFAPVGKRNIQVKGGKNTILRVCPSCGVAFLPY